MWRLYDIWVQNDSKNLEKNVARGEASKFVGSYNGSFLIEKFPRGKRWRVIPRGRRGRGDNRRLFGKKQLEQRGPAVRSIRRLKMTIPFDRNDFFAVVVSVEETWAILLPSPCSVLVFPCRVCVTRWSWRENGNSREGWKGVEGWVAERRER